ncbi:hypothetical protein PAPHI01_2238 [Pancytospora philotis]|nr:hypothetical protein PAPHI01_2238 [Pancytospora philotis]
MLSRFVRILLWVCSSSTKSGSVDIKGGPALVDYATFGSLEIMELNALEERTLGTLRKMCMARDCPELPHKLIDASAFWVAPSDKARCVVLSMLCKESPPTPLKQLLAHTGFASHRLLAKLLQPYYVKSLRSEVPDGIAISYQFSRAIEKHWEELRPVRECINECLLTATRMDFCDYVAQSGSRNTGFDFGVLAARKQFSERRGVFPEISRQIKLWLTCEDVSEELLFTVCEFTRTILHAGTLTAPRILSYKAYIAELVACSPHKELLALFNAFHNPSSAQRCIAKILNADGYRRVCPDFILNYLQWLKEFGSSPRPLINFTWNRYLQTGYALSRVLQLCENPRSFLQEVPQLLLYNAATRLRDDTDDIPRRDKAMRIIMNNLSPHTFIRILTKVKLGKYHAIMGFMLGYLDDGARVAYIADVRKLKKSKRKNRSKKFVDVYRDIEIELMSHTNNARAIVTAAHAV